MNKWELLETIKAKVINGEDINNKESKLLVEHLEYLDDELTHCHRRIDKMCGGR